MKAGEDGGHPFFSFTGSHVIIYSMKTRIRKLLSFIPMIFMLCTIFSFSAQTGEESGNLSYKISYKIVEIKNNIAGEEKTAEELAVSAGAIHFYVRKAAHMTEYFILAVTILFPLYVYGMRGKRWLLTAGVLGVISAALDEYHQSFVGGRGPSVRDVCIDSVGIFTAVIMAEIFYAAVLKKKDKGD